MFHTVLMYQVTREFYPCRGTSVPHSVDVPGDARVLSVQGYEFDVTRVEVEASVFPAGVRSTRLSQDLTRAHRPISGRTSKYLSHAFGSLEIVALACG